MKVIFIPIKKNVIVNLMIIAALFIALISLNIGNAMTVLSNVTSNPIYKGNEDKPIIAFECNVVWGTEYIPQILDIFKENDIKITFFIGGEWAEDNPELLKRIVAEGHEIGNHGYKHKHHSQLDINGNRNEIQDTENAVKSITGIKTTLFAPPYGEFNKTTIQAADSLGYNTIMWSIDTIDWRRDGVDKIIQRVISSPYNGALVLMHPTADTVTALPIIIKALLDSKYKISTVSEAISD